MSAVRELLRASFDYERTHQVVLQYLIQKSPAFRKSLLDIDAELRVSLEKHSMDLLLESADDGAFLAFIEIKMWSTLWDEQRKKHGLYLEKKGGIGYYILLGTSQFEYDESDLTMEVHSSTKRLSYSELETALGQLSGDTPEVIEIAKAYRELLTEQRQSILDGLGKGTTNRFYYYVLYSMMQEKLSPIKTRIYPVQHRGEKPVMILNPSDWMSNGILLQGVKALIYFELQDDRLILKYHLESDDQELRNQVRSAMIEASSQAFTGMSFKPSPRYGRRTGKQPYITACSLDRDFSDVQRIEQSCEIFRAVNENFGSFVDAVGGLIHQSGLE